MSKSLVAKYLVNHFASSHFDYISFRNSDGEDYLSQTQEKGSKYKSKMFDMNIPIQTNWKESDRRLLIVISNIDSTDIKSQKLLDNQQGIVLTNVLRYAKQRAKEINNVLDIKDNVKDFSLCAINFATLRTFKISSEQTRDAAYTVMLERLNKFIDKAKPTHVLLLGSEARKYVVDTQVKCKHSHLFNGTVYDLQTPKGTSYKCVTSIEPNITYGYTVEEDNDDEESVGVANMLGQISRNIVSLYLDKKPFSIRDVKAKPILIDTVEKFDKLYSKMTKANVLAIDTETVNLNKLANKILTFQVALDTKVGYIIPIYHSDTPFSGEELKHILNCLRKLFARNNLDKKKIYHIYHNAKFDLVQLRRDLKLPLIRTNVWDTMAGMHLLDENTKILKNFGVSLGALAELCVYYENDFYFQASSFGKKDRENISSTDLYNKDFLNYCAFDVQSIFGIHEQQLLEAETEDYYGQSYKVPFLRMMLLQMSANIQTMSHMEQAGVLLDIPYLAKMSLKNSTLSKEIEKELNVMYQSKATKHANEILLKQNKVPSKGLFGSVSKWMFDIRTQAHQTILFEEVLGLEPLSYGKSGKGSYGKAFLAEYKDVPEVQAYSNYVKAVKIKTSYVDAFLKKVGESEDGKIDSRLRPGFGFWGIVTGRGNSFSPSLQQIPQHSNYAKFIKRSFISAPGTLIVKLDYSAHEVRMWSYQACDKKLAHLFLAGRKLRQKYRKSPSPELAKDLKIKGDIHRLNAQTFFGVDPAECTDEQRQGVKGITFGAIYGKSVRSLARDTNTPVKQMEKIYSLYFETYKDAKNWLDQTVLDAQKYLYTTSMFGRKRRLFGYMTGVPSIMAAMNRRAMNSPIQGEAADVGHASSWLFMCAYYDFLLEHNYLTSKSSALPNYTEAMVHDSSRQGVQNKFILPTIQIQQYVYTLGVANWYEDNFDLKGRFLVPLEVEFEVGWCDVAMNKFDWSEKQLKEIITKSLQDQYEELKESHSLNKSYVENSLEEIYSVPENVQKWLDENYPYLANP